MQEQKIHLLVEMDVEGDVTREHIRDATHDAIINWRSNVGLSGDEDEGAVTLVSTELVKMIPPESSKPYWKRNAGVSNWLFWPLLVLVWIPPIITAIETTMQWRDERTLDKCIKQVMPECIVGPHRVSLTYREVGPKPADPKKVRVMTTAVWHLNERVN